MNLKTLHHISYGLYVISSRNEEKINGQIANVAFQITSEPPTIGISINKKNYTHECINTSNAFTVSILSKETPMNFIGNFGFKSGKTINKFDGVKYKLGKTKIPIMQEYTIGAIEAEVIQKISQGTHTLFIGKILNAEVYNNSSPMTYDYYHNIKGGYSPKTAPTFYKEVDKPKQRKKEEKSMDKYVCDVCGYVYDPEYGDPDNNIASGTDFQDLPDDWVCPVCGAPKSEFSKQE